MGNKIKFTTYLNNARTGTKKGACVASVIHNGCRTKQALTQEVAKRSGMPPLQAMAFMEALGEVACEGIAAGEELNFGPFCIGISMKGTLKDANARPDRAKNGLGVFVRPMRAMTNALLSLEPENATPMDRPWINEVGCEGLAELNIVKIGSRVVVNGKNLRVDESRADEGVWLEDATGARREKGEIVDTTSSRIVCVFGEAPAQDVGRLAVYTRDGGAQNGATGVARRRVRIVG